ncbi:SGNH/GDSL hydrolase family protein [Streptomyces genisteinicus]|uniref:SGNH/GDSL hydrolase family protein n=1 Tax=Streptomyces genisteinicus TaxID=2768068 RepID=A0A7H0HV24_9ACTN|nr:SGNH/GDSL hydrolase family protein [Streptomyces genisteinicus]QNP64390.1 SGNH/GDSL hydrolase family protein [Streptomyces genisteinicus]
MPFRFPNRVLSAAVASAAIAAVGLGAAAPAQAVSDPLDYVALGDSYSAGSGVLPLDPSASLLCARTTKNYPNLLADRTGADFTDVTCGGAKTEHFATAQYPGVPPQFDALRADTDLVTLTIGGNDNNTFINAILACGGLGVLTAGQGSPCKNTHGSSFSDDIARKTYPAITAALNEIRARSPKAEVAILGYPWIVPEQSVPGCFLKMPIAKGDVPYLRKIQADLNSAVERAANATGATFVDMAAASEGHDACTPAGTRWIEPVLFGTNIVPVHPNAVGEAAMADRTAAVLGLR